MKIKKDMLRKKLHVCELLKKEEKDAKARKKTAVVGDMKPMEETLKIINHDIVQVCLPTKAQKLLNSRSSNDCDFAEG